MSQHLQSHLQFHFKLVCDKLTKTVEELETVKKHYQEQKADLEFMMEELEMVQGEGDELKKEVQIVEVQNQKGKEEIEALKAKNHELKVELKMIKAQLLEQKKEFGFVVDLNEKQSNQLDMIQIVAHTHELRRELGIAQARNREVKQELESVRNRLKEYVGPTVVWRISTLQTLSNVEHSRKKLVLYSDTFYTGPHGYRIQVNLNLNVVTSQQGQAHLSLNILVLKGKYDSILPWPLMKKLKFTILDQQEDFARRSNISCSLVPQYGNKCFQRPKAEENQATDDILLCYQKRLEKGEYMVNGVLFLQVDVSDVNNNVLS